MLSTEELTPWPLPPAIRDGTLQHPAFRVWPATGALSLSPIQTLEPGSTQQASSSAVSSGSISGVGSGVAVSVVGKEDEARCPWWPMLHKRVVQHNLRVLAKAYSRVTFPRLCELLSLDADTAEAVLAELVSDGTLYAKVDRPAGIIYFARPQPPAETMRAWAADIDGVLSLLETTTHLIAKEAMVHGVTLAVPPVSR